MLSGRLFVAVSCATFAACAPPPPRETLSGASELGALPDLTPRAIDPRRLGSLAPMVSFEEVEKRLGHGAQAEGPVTLYRSQDDKIAYWFWYAPIDIKRADKWAPANLGLLIVTEGRDGPIIWPEAMKGREMRAVFEEFANRHGVTAE